MSRYSSIIGLVQIGTKTGSTRSGKNGAPDIATEAWSLFQQIFFSQRRGFTAVIREFDLIPPHWIALQALEEPMPMGELAKILVCDNSNVTWITDRLEERGLVERTPSERDRRVKLVVLTPEGRRVREEIQARLSDPPRAIKQLSREDQRNLSAILKRVASGLAAS